MLDRYTLAILPIEFLAQNLCPQKHAILHKHRLTHCFSCRRRPRESIPAHQPSKCVHETRDF